VRKTRSLTLPLLALSLACASGASADEGMWPFDMVPRQAIEKAHGVKLTDAWLDHLRLASVKFSSGGSGSFVSKNGLVLTNQHVAGDCLAKVASAAKDYVAEGYVAGQDGPELKCPDLELTQLVSIEDVTDRVRAAKTDGMSDADANTAMKGVMASLEKACTDKGNAAPLAPNVTTQCDVVTLYAGGKYQLYTLNRYTDVRVVFAPEEAIGFFGGDPDNFTYPRFDLDMAIFRVYSADKPFSPRDYLRWSSEGPRDGETVFVSGHPAATDRMDTLAELATIRDVYYPYYLDVVHKEAAALYALGKNNLEGAREARESLRRVENGRKAREGEEAGLKDPSLMKKKADDEAALRKAIAADPKLAAAYGSVFGDIERAQKVATQIYTRYAALERGPYRSELFTIARALVRMPRELATPNERRLKEYRDSKLDSLKLELFSSAPIYGQVEAVLFAGWLDRLVRDVGAGDPLVKSILAGRTPQVAAAEIVAGSKLTDIHARRALFDGGALAVGQSSDPLVRVVVQLDDAARDIRKRYEDEVEGPMRQSGQKIAQAVFAVRGTSVYPDATYTLRLSPGVVKGYTEAGKVIGWATDFAGMYKHATGTDPFKLPRRWLDAKSAVAPKAPLDFVSTNDIIGGNSGSPVVNVNGDLVGLIFDGNLSSLPNQFVYGETTQRAVSVDSAGMIEALRHVYGATALVGELLAEPGAK
jgi:Peptidase S46